MSTIIVTNGQAENWYQDGSSSSSVDSEADTEEASESTEDASEVGTDQLESSSDSSETESGGEMEEAAAVRPSSQKFDSGTNTLCCRPNQ
ncbi:hypothetical protein F7725_027914 [Dissostichus mawsoni]|uniref:Uncharacterized protein n=1 Tax=Dissostichus mawsoni TaxID=36200 RepID=A0A7J5XE91_DISMA|nr:hypothetical protein F7725_027914 [Dissostichus mawsoni]